MKQTELQQIIKEEILKEIKPNIPLYTIASSDYKKFYQMVELNKYWDVDWSGGYYSVDFYNLNEFDFFYFIHSFISSDNWRPNMCIINQEDLEEGFMNWSIDDDPVAQENVIRMIKANKA